MLTDGELEAEDIDLALAETLREGGPWGQSFPEPLFDGIFLVRDARIVGERHWKLRLETSTSARPVEAIAFNQADEIRLVRDGRVHVAYRLDVNDYGGIRRPQLVIEAMQCV